jgi:hypothetical protein
MVRMVKDDIDSDENGKGGQLGYAGASAEPRADQQARCARHTFLRKAENPAVYAEGVPLAAMFCTGTQFLEDQVVAWMKQIASAVASMHDGGTLHHHLSVDTIKIDTNGKLFGFEPVDQAGVSFERLPVIQTSSYDPRDDMWAVGCILLELLLERR